MACHGKTGAHHPPPQAVAAIPSDHNLHELPRLGQGSAFAIEVPRGDATRIAAAPAAATDVDVLRDKLIAVVDDERDVRDGLAELRARYGAALPGLIMSGDTTPEIFRLVREQRLPLLSKPVRAALQHLLSGSREAAHAAA